MSSFLSLPVSLHGPHLLSQAAQLLLDSGPSLCRNRVRFLFQRLPFDLHLGDPALKLVDLGRHTVDLDAQFGGTFIHQVDGLVGQKAIADIAIRQGRGRHDGGVQNAHTVVYLILFLEAPQNGNGILDTGFLHHHGLKPPFQGGILFDMPAVFIDGSGADTPQGSPGQGRFQHVRGVHGPFTGAGPHQRVQLVDEEDDIPLRTLHLFENRLQAVLELPSVLGAGNKGPHVQGDQTPVFQCF
jgi:hypothetical protein